MFYVTHEERSEGHLELEKIARPSKLIRSRRRRKKKTLSAEGLNTELLESVFSKEDRVEREQEAPWVKLSRAVWTTSNCTSFTADVFSIDAALLLFFSYFEEGNWPASSTAEEQITASQRLLGYTERNNTRKDEPTHYSTDTYMWYSPFTPQGQSDNGTTAQIKLTTKSQILILPKRPTSTQMEIYLLENNCLESITFIL